MYYIFFSKKLIFCDKVVNSVLSRSYKPTFSPLEIQNCFLIFQLPGVDYQHCVIEYSEQDDCFIIQDLNTAQGTYVNDVRIQNAAVRLAPGDYVRFGYNGQPFELQVENQPQVSIPIISS